MTGSTLLAILPRFDRRPAPAASPVAALPEPAAAGGAGADRALAEALAEIERLRAARAADEGRFAEEVAAAERSAAALWTDRLAAELASARAAIEEALARSAAALLAPLLEEHARARTVAALRECVGTVLARGGPVRLVVSGAPDLVEAVEAVAPATVLACRAEVGETDVRVMIGEAEISTMLAAFRDAVAEALERAER